MKKIQIIILLCLPLFSFAQQKNDCNYKKKYDDFEKTTSYSFSNKTLSSRGGYHLYLYTNESQNLCFGIFTSILSGCVTSSSFVSFMFEDESIRKIYYSGDIDCGTTMISINLTKEDLEILASKRIKKVRVHIDSDFDYEVTEKKYSDFSKNINCLLSIYSGEKNN